MSSVPSSLSTTTTSTTTTLANNVYKGKITHRSWQHLPPELIRLIVTHYLLDTSATAYCPQIWQTRETWHHRMVYTVFRDTNDMEKLMCITPSWGAALETHLFWFQACAAIDPTDCFAHHAIVRPTVNAGSAAPVAPFRLSPYRHFRNLANCTCIVCRINSPHTPTGLAGATQGKRPYATLHLGPIPVCREHRRSAASFCALCLCSSAPIEAGIVENEDEETWTGVEATCRACRNEGLWRRVKDSARDREAVGIGRHGNWERERDVDWETRQAVDAFVEMGEGSISDVITIAQEKHWLRIHTKLPDMLGQALAASRFGGVGGYDSEVAEEEEEDEEEEDPELMSLTEDAGGVRDLAISDWARNRILDGHWFSPADQWYKHSVPGHPTVVRAEHPCPWNRDATYMGAMQDDESEDADAAAHPRPATVQAPTPPTFSLCEQAYIAFQKQMRLILLPALTNLVRKVVIECGAVGADPAVRASRMGTEEVLRELREEEGVWYNGIDWLERRANGEREERRRRRAEESKEEDTSSSSSSKSDGSHTTSPVLSTTTLQTTPSPSPTADKGECPQVVVPIPVSPVLEAPELLHPIPYVPVTAAGWPHFSLEAFRMVWREACAPLYHCRCKICERAMMTANVAAGNVIPPQVPSQVAEQINPTEIRIDDHDGEEEVDQAEERTETTETTEQTETTTEQTEEEEEFESLEDFDELLYTVTPQKRTSADVDRDGDEDADADGDPDDEEEDHDDSAFVRPKKSRTPPKRMRMTNEKIILPPSTKSKLRSKPPSTDSLLSSPTRLRKRSSEELEEGDEGRDTESFKKRMRVGFDEGASDEGSPPISLTETGTEDRDDDDSESSAVRHSSSKPRSKSNSAPSIELDGLYTLDDAEDV